MPLLLRPMSTVLGNSGRVSSLNVLKCERGSSTKNGLMEKRYPYWAYETTSTAKHSTIVSAAPGIGTGAVLLRDQGAVGLSR